MGLGSAITLSISLFIYSRQKPPAPKVVEVIREDEAKIQEIRMKASSEIDILQRKMLDAQEKATSFRNLSEMLKLEVAQLTKEKEELGAQLLSKTPIAPKRKRTKKTSVAESQDVIV
jgi:hypothetical protein